MSVDTKMSLRTSSCLANPSRMQAARWGSVDTKMSLRRVLRFAIMPRHNNSPRSKDCLPGVTLVVIRRGDKFASFA